MILGVKRAMTAAFMSTAVLGVAANANECGASCQSDYADIGKSIDKAINLRKKLKGKAATEISYCITRL